MITLKVQRIGDDLGVVLPREALDRLKAGDGATLILTETPEGLHLTASDPEFDRQMALAEEGMAAYRNTLRALSK